MKFNRSICPAILALTTTFIATSSHAGGCDYSSSFSCFSASARSEVAITAYGYDSQPPAYTLATSMQPGALATLGSYSTGGVYIGNLNDTSSSLASSRLQAQTVAQDYAPVPGAVTNAETFSAASLYDGSVKVSSSGTQQDYSLWHDGGADAVLFDELIYTRTSADAFDVTLAVNVSGRIGLSRDGEDIPHVYGPYVDNYVTAFLAVRDGSNLGYSQYAMNSYNGSGIYFDTLSLLVHLTPTEVNPGVWQAYLPFVEELTESTLDPDIDFGHSAYLSMTAPEGTTFTSASGVLLSEPRTANGVPEPGTWALMICGFGLAGAALRRQPAVAV